MAGDTKHTPEPKKPTDPATAKAVSWRKVTNAACHYVKRRRDLVDDATDEMGLALAEEAMRAEMERHFRETFLAGIKDPSAVPEVVEALRFLADWRMRDGTPCFCSAGKNESEPKGRMPTNHSTACDRARAALAKLEGGGR